MTRRILHLITGLGQGGAEAVLERLVTNMDKAAFENIVVSLSGKGRYGSILEQKGIPVYCLGCSSIFALLCAPFKYRRITQKTKPDLVQAWMYHANFFAMLMKWLRICKSPVVFNIRCSSYNFKNEKWTTRLAIRLGALFSRCAAAVIYIAKVSARQHEKMGYAKDKTVFIYNGFNTNIFKPSPLGYTQFREKYHLTSDHIVIGLVGRDHPQKDLPNFCKAMGVVKKSDSNARFVLVGSELDSDNKNLVALLERYNLLDCTLLLGFQPSPKDMTSAFDIYVSSSFCEGLPNVVGEAMSCGVPCVVTDVGGSADIVGDSGLIVPSRDSGALAEAVLKLCQMGHEERVRRGAQARKRIQEEFSLGVFVKNYQDLYGEIIRKTACAE